MTKMTARPLSAMERALVLLDEAQPFNGVMSFRVRGRLEEAELRAAMGVLQKRHPLLRMVVEGQALVERAGELALLIVDRRDDDSWRGEAEKVLNQPFPAGELLARMVWVRGDDVSELLTGHHHLIADAHSGLYLAHDLFSALAQARAGRPPSTESLPLRPPLSDLLPARVKGLRLFGAMNSFLYRSLANRARRPQKLAADAEPPFSERRNGIEHRALDPSQSHTLANRCRDEKTSVHGALVAALVTAAQADLARDSKRAATLGCFSAVNLRTELTEKLDGEVGVYISQVTTFHQPDPGTFWPLAREARDAVTRTKAAGEHYLTMPNMGLFIPRGDNPGPVLRQRLDRVSHAAVGITNLGRLSIQKSYGALTIEAVNVCVGMSVIGRLAMAASTFEGRLSLNFMFVEPLISRARASRLADRVKAQLLTAST